MRFLEAPQFIPPRDYFSQEVNSVPFDSLEEHALYTLNLLIGDRQERASTFPVEIEEKYKRNGSSVVELAFLNADAQVSHRAVSDMDGTSIQKVRNTIITSVKTGEIFRIQQGYIKEIEDENGVWEWLDQEALELPGSKTELISA